jgi:hypothetical protein
MAQARRGKRSSSRRECIEKRAAGRRRRRRRGGGGGGGRKCKGRRRDEGTLQNGKAKSEGIIICYY